MQNVLPNQPSLRPWSVLFWLLMGRILRISLVRDFRSPVSWNCLRRELPASQWLTGFMQTGASQLCLPSETIRFLVCVERCKEWCFFLSFALSKVQLVNKSFPLSPCFAKLKWRNHNHAWEWTSFKGKTQFSSPYSKRAKKCFLVELKCSHTNAPVGLRIELLKHSFCANVFPCAMKWQGLFNACLRTNTKLCLLSLVKGSISCRRVQRLGRQKAWQKSFLKRENYFSAYPLSQTGFFFRTRKETSGKVRRTIFKVQEVCVSTIAAGKRLLKL